MNMCCNVECKLHLQYLQAPDLWPHTCVGVGRFWSVCLCWCQFCSDTPGCCLRLCSWHMSRRSLRRCTISGWLNTPVDVFLLLHISSRFKFFRLICVRLFLTFAAGASESERGVHLILDLNEGIQNHRTTAIWIRACQQIMTLIYVNVKKLYRSTAQ